jgi:hypothetical protein
MEYRPTAPSSRATRKILWLSFILAIVAYSVVGYLVFTEQVRPSPLPYWVWPLLALFAGAAAFVLPSRIADAAPESDNAVRIPEILGWALAETVAIIGLVSVALGAPRGPLVVYLVASAVLLWFLRPQD